MTVKPAAVFIWGAAGVPLLGVGLALGGVFTVALWAAGGIVALTTLRHVLR
jgi:hypothetical protein